MNSETENQGYVAARRKINNQLESIKVMLVHKRNEMSFDSWKDFVELTRNSILNRPLQYVHLDEVEEDVIRSIIRTLFDEFIAREYGVK